LASFRAESAQEAFPFALNGSGNHVPGSLEKNFTIFPGDRNTEVMTIAVLNHELVVSVSPDNDTFRKAVDSERPIRLQVDRTTAIAYGDREGLHADLMVIFRESLQAE
jgi:hypothetical protein